MKIALMGYARSGKDTVFKMIEQELGTVYKLAFGDELKQKFHYMFPHIPVAPKPRDGYEKFGQGMRDIYPDIWVKAVDSKSKYIHKHTDWHTVVTDLRQPNEAKWAKENGYAIVYIHCDDFVRMGRATGDKEWHSVNSSEEDIWKIDYDYCIWNEGSEDHLRAQVKILIEGMEKLIVDQT